eukprot:539633-Amphidinium_carterae.1
MAMDAGGKSVQSIASTHQQHFSLQLRATTLRQAVAPIPGHHHPYWRHRASTYLRLTKTSLSVGGITTGHLPICQS